MTVTFSGHGDDGDASGIRQMTQARTQTHSYTGTHNTRKQTRAHTFLHRHTLIDAEETQMENTCRQRAFNFVLPFNYWAQNK